MLIVLSPAKRLDFTEADPAIPGTERRFREDTASLSTTARRQTKADLHRLMGISDDLATLNVERFKAFDPESTDGVQAAFAFAGFGASIAPAPSLPGAVAGSLSETGGRVSAAPPRTIDLGFGAS
ncbi:MAG: peroxide stress protein YaaA, partial [Albidovulum sp.]